MAAPDVSAASTEGADAVSDSPHDYGLTRDFKLCQKCRTRRPVWKLVEMVSGVDETRVFWVCADEAWCDKTREGK